MKTIFASIAMFGFAFSGTIGLAMNMDRHYRQIHTDNQHKGRQQQLLETSVAALLLCISMICAVIASGIGYGLVTWFGLITAVCMAIALMLTYTPLLITKAKWISTILAVTAFSALLIVGN